MQIEREECGGAVTGLDRFHVALLAIIEADLAQDSTRGVEAQQDEGHGEERRQDAGQDDVVGQRLLCMTRIRAHGRDLPRREGHGASPRRALEVVQLVFFFLLLSDLASVGERAD